MLSEALAKFIKKTTYEDLSSDVVEFTKLCILDWYGSAVAGKDKVPIQMIAEFVDEMGGKSQSSLVTGGKSSMVNAALLNGAASHIVELDDIHKQSIVHAGTVVIPAALSIAEAKGKSGKDLITAVALGYDVCYRIGEAVSPSHYYYWHNTATCGTFGAAVAAAKLLDLNEEQIIYTLGSAGTQAAGLWEFIEDGAMSKQLHTAKAAANGVTAALLAEKGFTSASKILEGKRGFFHAMSSEFNESRITDGLGEIFKIIENSFKIHASCRHTHPSVDLMIDLKNEHQLQTKDVKKIKVKTYQVVLDITDNPNPTTIYAAKFSVQYCVALGLKNGSAGLHDFTQEALEDQEIRQIMEKIEVSVDYDINEAYPEKWGSKVEIELNNGDLLSLETNYPKGDPEVGITADELIKKFRTLASALSINEQESMVQKIMNVNKILNVETFFSTNEVLS
ncbi:MmgE/PrpD family protein [Bacillus sp. 1P02SD]|uniref:MmgE/PrpD family protein n=1 Tax=Bacillus sp. 1P02SD TaxID=3132264 RepID=UPI00399F0D28